MPADPTPTVARRGDVTVVRLGPEFERIDELTCEAARTGILAAVDAADRPRIVIDLSRTQFFGSSFLEVLFRVHARLRDREDGRFAVCGLTSYCEEVVHVVYLDRLVDVFPDEETAVAALDES